jgi:hypothetical protein
MSPPYSCAVPAGTRARRRNVKIGISKQSQKRTKRAALRERPIQHARQHHRLVGDDPDAAPSMRAKPVTMLRANASWISKKSPSSTTLRSAP